MFIFTVCCFSLSLQTATKTKVGSRQGKRGSEKESTKPKVVVLVVVVVVVVVNGKRRRRE